MINEDLLIGCLLLITFLKASKNELTSQGWKISDPETSLEIKFEANPSTPAIIGLFKDAYSNSLDGKTFLKAGKSFKW